MASVWPWLPTQDACSGSPLSVVTWTVWLESISSADLTWPLSMRPTTCEVSACLYVLPELAYRYRKKNSNKTTRTATNGPRK